MTELANNIKKIEKQIKIIWHTPYRLPQNKCRSALVEIIDLANAAIKNIDEMDEKYG